MQLEHHVNLYFRDWNY